MDLRVALVCLALCVCAEAGAMQPMSRVPVEIRQAYANGDATTLRCPAQPLGFGQDCTFEIARKGEPPRRWPVRFSDSGYDAIVTDYRYTDSLGDGAFWLNFDVGCKARDLAMVPDAPGANNVRCTLHLERDGDVVRATQVAIRYYDSDDLRIFERTLDARDAATGFDAFDATDEVIGRCNVLTWGLAKPYASTPLNLEELQATARRMRDGASPLFKILAVPLGKVEAALREEPGTNLTVSVAIRDNAVRILGDKPCGVMIDEFLAPMLFPGSELVPHSEMEALRERQRIERAHLDWWLFLLLVREVSELQEGASKASAGRIELRIADCIERHCPQIAINKALQGSRDDIVRALRTGKSLHMGTVREGSRVFDVWSAVVAPQLEVSIKVAVVGEDVDAGSIGIVWD